MRLTADSSTAPCCAASTCWSGSTRRRWRWPGTWSGCRRRSTLPPYLSLHARLTDFDPYDVTRALEERTLVRLLTMRGTIHLLTPEDALVLRPWTQVVIDRVQRNHDRAGAAVRSRALVQTPPRGTWKGSGGVVYEPLEEWVGAPLR